ncbi:hypothetical protein EYF80_025780 [Liparis tanakae]|uniref:Uncharacterized protein n=1 Tax=Liparis tanakae TaxID=230148 RepID=A0A4Z2HDW1_9TELE|nr:hypothetical protein EYF80_025780 [Liparis tanakae]
MEQPKTEYNKGAAQEVRPVVLKWRFNNKIALSGVLQDYLEDTRGKDNERLRPSGRAAGSHFCRPGFDGVLRGPLRNGTSNASRSGFPGNGGERRSPLPPELNAFPSTFPPRAREKGPAERHRTEETLPGGPPRCQDEASEACLSPPEFSCQAHLDGVTQAKRGYI